MKYVVEILKDGRVWARDVIDAPARRLAVAAFVARDIVGAFETVEDFYADDDDTFPVDVEEVRATHVLSVRVHRVAPTHKEAKEEYAMVKMLNEAPDSPFRGMIAMPKEVP